MVSVDELIDSEVKMYLGFCNAAAQHDEQEVLYRQLAHVVFYHIQEMRSTGQPTTVRKSIQPISHR
jgi:hypothetical protein